MAVDSFGLLAVLCIAASEFFSCRNLRVSVGLFVVAVLLLLFAFRSSYFISAVFLSIAAVAVWLYQKYYESFLRGLDPQRWIPRTLAGFIHLIGIWILPFLVQWGYSDLYDVRPFYEQEVGHLVPSSFYFTGLVLLQMMVMPPGYENCGIRHQRYESIFSLATGIVYFLIFRIAHILRDDNYIFGHGSHRLHAKDWDHEVLGLVWACSGGTGLVLSSLKQKSQLHYVFPALYGCFTMLSHSAIIRGAARDQMVTMTWMMLHKVHAVCFGVGGLCRLLCRMPESTFFFYLGAVVFCFSAEDEAKALVDRLSEPGDEDSMEEHPVHHIAVLNVVVFGIVLYPLHLLLTGEMRKLTDRDPAVSAGFSSLSTGENVGDENDSRMKDSSEGKGLDSSARTKETESSERIDAEEEVALLM